jgi:hypothetical protein
MTIEHWTDDRLDQLADAVDGLREQSELNNRNVDILVGIVTAHQERFAAVLDEIRDIKVEIRGLQTENRRILDRLFGQQE